MKNLLSLKFFLRQINYLVISLHSKTYFHDFHEIFTKKV